MEWHISGTVYVATNGASFLMRPLNTHILSRWHNNMSACMLYFVLLGIANQKCCNNHLFDVWLRGRSFALLERDKVIATTEENSSWDGTYGNDAGLDWFGTCLFLHRWTILPCIHLMNSGSRHAHVSCCCKTATVLFCQEARCIPDG